MLLRCYWALPTFSFQKKSCREKKVFFSQKQDEEEAFFLLKNSIFAPCFMRVRQNTSTHSPFFSFRLLPAHFAFLPFPPTHKKGESQYFMETSMAKNFLPEHCNIFSRFSFNLFSSNYYSRVAKGIFFWNNWLAKEVLHETLPILA